MLSMIAMARPPSPRPALWKPVSVRRKLTKPAARRSSLGDKAVAEPVQLAVIHTGCHSSVTQQTFGCHQPSIGSRPSQRRWRRGRSGKITIEGQSMSHRNYLLGGVALCGVLALALPAKAQSASGLNNQIQELQDQVRRLNQQLQNLQGQVQQTQQNQVQTEKTVTEMKSTPGGGVGGAVVKMLNGRPVFESADGQTTLGITGRLHFDMGAYNWKP